LYEIKYDLSKNKKTLIFIPKTRNMIIIPVKNSNTLESSLKSLKFKVYKTKQTDILREKQTYVKKSVKKRNQINKAKHIQKMKDYSGS
jgi:small subunit ribosomal protein S21